MQWSDVATNQAISYQTLKDACDALVFLQIGSLPPPGKTLSQMVTAEWIQSRVDIESSYLTGVPDNELVVKSQVVPVSRLYWKLTPCSGEGIAYTRIAPSVPNQQYVIPGTGQKWYNLASDTAIGPQTTIPSGYNGSIQKISTKTFCAA